MVSLAKQHPQSLFLSTIHGSDNSIQVQPLCFKLLLDMIISSQILLACRDAWDA